MNIKEALFRVVDVETTGLDPKLDKIVELAVCDVATRSILDVDYVGPDAAQIAQATPLSWLCNPGMPIPPVAKAVHGICDRHVANEPRAERLVEVELAAMHADNVVYVAHHAAFDRSMLEAAGLPTALRWLCTHRLSMHLWPEAPSHKNEALRYWLGYDILPWGSDRFPEGDGVAHRAGHDARVTALILIQLLGHCVRSHDIDELIEFANGPVVLQGLMGFGKHHDWTWSECAQKDRGYLEWILRGDKQEWDKDKWHTALHHCGRLL